MLRNLSFCVVLVLPLSALAQDKPIDLGSLLRDEAQRNKAYSGTDNRVETKAIRQAVQAERKALVGKVVKGEGEVFLVNSNTTGSSRKGQQTRVHVTLKVGSERVNTTAGNPADALPAMLKKGDRVIVQGIIETIGKSGVTIGKAEYARAKPRE